MIRFRISGIVVEIDSMNCAEISGRLGAGRVKSSDQINYAVGLELCVHLGHRVKEGLYFCTTVRHIRFLKVCRH